MKTATISAALDDLRIGKMSILVDDAKMGGTWYWRLGFPPLKRSTLWPAKDAA